MEALNRSPLNSCLYECEVYHQRLYPRKHGFKNRLFFFFLDLDELSQLRDRFHLLKIEQRGFFSFQEADHLPKYSGSLKQRAIQAFQDAGLSPEIHRVYLLTNLRTLGYVFNPISLFYAVDADGRCMGALVQVENTFREMKLFPVLNHQAAQQSPAKAELFLSEQVKWFYVSPYSRPDQSFRFEIEIPGETIRCRVSSHTDQQLVLDSGFQGKKLPLKEKTLLKMALRYPLITWGVITMIHCQAIVLWLKRTPFFMKGDGLAQQREVLRPRSDLKRYHLAKEVIP